MDLYPIGLFLFAVSICIRAGTGPFAIPLGDSSAFMYIAKLMQNGQVPYLDVFDHKGLLLYVINYIGLCLGGSTGIWIYEIISLFISMFYCYKTALIITNNRMVSFFTVLCSYILLGTYFERGNYVEEYALPFISISLFIFIKHLFTKEYSIKTANLIILGLSFGAVLMLRPDMISVWIVYYTAIIIKLLFEKRYKLLIKYPIYILLGLFIVIIPCIIYLIANNAFSAFIAQYFEFNLKYSSFNGIKAWIYSIIVYSSTNIFKIAVFVYAILIANIKRYNLFIVLSGIVYLTVTILLITISGNLYYHYAIILIPCFIIPVGYFLAYIRINYLVKFNTSIQLIVLLVIVSIITNTQLIAFVHIYEEFPLRNRQYEHSIDSELVKFIESNTSVNDSIIVFGNKSLIYLQSNRYSASKYFYQYPIGTIDKKIGIEFIEDIKENTPMLIVDLDNRMDRNDMMAIFLKQYTNLNYDKFNIGVFNVYLRKMK
jgi:hypothetical protein